MREKTAVSRKDLIAIVPPVRILDGVGVDIPPIAVPVHIHGTKNQLYRIRNHPYHHPPKHDELNFL